MKVAFTRHAERRMKLYAIDREDVRRELEKLDLQSIKRFEKQFIITDSIRSRVKKPVKIVFTKDVDGIVLITVYPLKKGTQ